jgi:diguanylate cyclase (GGDEF)-like protein
VLGLRAMVASHGGLHRLVVGGAALLAGFGVTVSWLQVSRGDDAMLANWLLVGAALLAAAAAAQSRSLSGVRVIINPAVVFTVTLLLSWGLAAAVLTQVAATMLLTARCRLPWVRGGLKGVQLVMALLAAGAVLRLSGAPAGAGVSWTDVDAVTRALGAVLAWLAAYLLVGVVLAAIGRRHRRLPVPPLPSGHLLLFKATLVSLSPVLAGCVALNVATLPIVLVPLYATFRMAWLSAERDRHEHLDALTALPDRAALRHRYDSLARGCDGPAAIVGADRRPHVAVMVIDIDVFSKMHSSVGYESGERLLVEAAHRLAGPAADGAVAGRLGGGEFALLRVVADATTGREFADAIAARLGFRAVVDGVGVEITPSIGVALREDAAADDFATVLRRAYTAMRAARRGGQAVEVYDRRLRTVARSVPTSSPGLDLRADLRRALRRQVGAGQLALHYQPQVLLATGRVGGVEALLRWSHPTRGAIDAGTAIAAVEGTPIMSDLTSWVIGTATTQLASWHRQGLPVRLSLNVSARDLAGGRLVDRLGTCLAEHALRPDLVVVEITESALMADTAPVYDTVHAMAALGVGIALDDFGTGYSSLRHLRRLPVTEVKIDRTFVAGMTRSTDDEAIVASTIELAHALGLRTVAEGVADQSTVVRLAELGCDLGQGWHFSAAVGSEHVPSLVRLLDRRAPVSS